MQFEVKNIILIYFLKSIAKIIAKIYFLKSIAKILY
jgi:hypothetical protein